MKDYKRLTKWSELGTLHVFDINGKEIPLCDVSPLDTDNLAGRLADLEDKIESGEIDYVADRGKQIACLTAENTELRATLSKMETVEKELRERLEKAVELENKINNGELVDAIWFKSWVNGKICCGSVIGYSDGCFVIACGDDLISANKIYTSREQARYGLDKKIDKKEE